MQSSYSKLEGLAVMLSLEIGVVVAKASQGLMSTQLYASQFIRGGVSNVCCYSQETGCAILYLLYTVEESKVAAIPSGEYILPRLSYTAAVASSIHHVE